MFIKNTEKYGISEIVINADLKKLTKESLSIIDTSTLKDKEIMMYIQAGILDLKRQGIYVEKCINDSLIQGAIVMFVKANFGMVDIKEKELSQKSYFQLCNNLSLSSEYKFKEEVDKNA